MIGGTGGEGGEGKVGPGREGLMALASAGCEMSSSSYTAGPRPQLPGLWAAELASVASTQALQRDGSRNCEAGGSGRRGWLGTSQEQAGQVRRWLRSGEARARMAGRAGSACMVNPRCRDAVPLFRDHFVRPIDRSAGWSLPNLSPFFVPDSVVFSGLTFSLSLSLSVYVALTNSYPRVIFARYSDFRYLVVWV